MFKFFVAIFSLAASAILLSGCTAQPTKVSPTPVPATPAAEELEIDQNLTDLEKSVNELDTDGDFGSLEVE